MAAAALEKELVRVLQALELQDLHESQIKTVFDTGGTISWREQTDGDNGAGDVIEAVTLEKLGELDRVFGKYLQQFTAARLRSGINGNREQEDETMAGSPLWTFLASDAANSTLMGDDTARTHSYAAYRALFAALHALINLSDGYATLEPSDKAEALLKALTASKVYLSWLQLPGGAAYGLFMPYVYRQVLDVLKKWVDAMASPESMASNGPSNGRGGGSQRDRTAKKKGSRARASQRSSQEDTEIDAATQKRLVKGGADLLDTLEKFLENFALSSSKESVLPTIEAVIHMQLAGFHTDNRSVSSAAARSQQLLERLLNDLHGDIVWTARVAMHSYIPGLCFHESTAVDARTATKLHKLAIEMIGLVQRTITRSMKCAADEDATDDVLDQLSSVYLGLAQNVCLHAPDRAEERQRVLGFAFQTCIAPDLHEQDRVRLVRFLASYSKSAKAKNRQFAVELVGKLILEPTTWSIKPSQVVPELEGFVGVAPLLEILADRSRDKVSGVRAKAIGAISAVLSAGLKNMSPVQDGEARKEYENETTVRIVDPDVIAASLHELLYTSVAGDDEEGNNDREVETPLMKRLVELFREGLHDDKTFVRKAAIQALEALIVVRPGSIDPVMRKDLVDMQERCTDKSLMIRVQAIKSLSSVLLKFPEDDEVQELWNAGVLPLCVDPEATVQAAALELMHRIVFERISSWYTHRNNDTQREQVSSVWDLVSLLDGVMVRCAQKALRLLLKDSKVDVKTMIKAAIHAIKTSMAQLDATGEAEPQYWSFSWIILEELAHSGQLVESTKSEQHNWSIVVECWNKLQQEELPTEFAEGSKRILRVIASLAPIIDAQDAKEIADSVLVSLHAFTIPLHVISEAVLALHSICKSKAPTAEKGREISFAWGKQILTACEANLRACFEGEPLLVHEHTMLIQKQLICVGEVALLEFNKDDDKNRESGVTLMSIATITPLVQLFLPPEIVPNRPAPRRPVDDDEDEEEKDEMVTPTKPPRAVIIPIPVRVCAFVTLGKLCLRDQDLAKTCITMFIRELRTCDNQDIRSNILLILGDLCIRYTALVDAYISTIALSFLDKSPLIRRNALLLFSQLILQDYIKWRESLLRFFLRAVVDEDDELSNLARHVLCGPLLLKAPHLFTNKFIEMIFVFNRFDGKVNFSEPFEREGIEEISLPGSARFSKRSQLYKFLLQNMSDEQKLQISMKICTEILEEVSDGKLQLCDNPSEITDFGTEAILKDTFAILCSPDIKLSSSRGDHENDDGDADDLANDGDDGSRGGAANATMATQLAAAKGKLLSKMSKKNFLENIVPVLIELKHKLESKRSPLMRYLLHYIRELFKLYGQEVRDILSADPQMAMEVEYDLRQYELQQQKLRQQGHSGRLSIGGGGLLSPTKSGRRSSTGTVPRTPLEILEAGQTPQLLSGEKDPRGRRRQSLPSAGTPAHPVRRRTVSSDEKKHQEEAGTTMLFSPGKDSQQRGKWHVTAKSPEVTSRKSGSRFSQKELEDSMQRDLTAAFDSASSSDEDLQPSTKPKKKKAAAKEKRLATKLLFDDVENGEDDDGDEVVLLPLKKKSKKKEKPSKPPVATKKKATAKEKAKKMAVGGSSDEEAMAKKSGDPLEMQTPDMRRAKRKRN